MLCAVHIHYLLHKAEKQKREETTTASGGKRWGWRPRLYTEYEGQLHLKITVLNFKITTLYPKNSLEKLGIKSYFLPHFKSRSGTQSSISLSFIVFCSSPPPYSGWSVLMKSSRGFWGTEIKVSSLGITLKSTFLSHKTLKDRNCQVS